MFKFSQSARRSGFTFLEAMLVLGIIVVLAAVTLPKMRGTFDRARLQSAVRDFSGMLRYARQFAVLRGDGAQVVIDPENGEYYMELVHVGLDGELSRDEQRPSRRRGDDLKELHLSREFVEGHVLPKRVFFTLVHSSAPTTDRSGLPRIVFYADGSASSGMIGIQDEKGKAYRVDVYRATGTAMTRLGQPVIPSTVRPLFVMPDRIGYEIIR
jgi:hypothetical protein